MKPRMVNNSVTDLCWLGVLTTVMFVGCVSEGGHVTMSSLNIKIKINLIPRNDISMWELNRNVFYVLASCLLEPDILLGEMFTVL